MEKAYDAEKNEKYFEKSLTKRKTVVYLHPLSKGGQLKSKSLEKFSKKSCQKICENKKTLYLCNPFWGGG